MRCRAETRLAKRDHCGVATVARAVTYDGERALVMVRRWVTGSYDDATAINAARSRSREVKAFFYAHRLGFVLVLLTMNAPLVGCLFLMADTRCKADVECLSHSLSL